MCLWCVDCDMRETGLGAVGLAGESTGGRVVDARKGRNGKGRRRKGNGWCEHPRQHSSSYSYTLPARAAAACHFPVNPAPAARCPLELPRAATSASTSFRSIKCDVFGAGARVYQADTHVCTVIGCQLATVQTWVLAFMAAAWPVPRSLYRRLINKSWRDRKLQ